MQCTEAAPTFLSSTGFAFTTVLEQHWREIHREYLGVQASMADYVERDLYDQGWQVFIMQNFPHREPVRGNDARCPFTMALIREHVPSAGVVCFSLMQPGTRIAPHEGRKGSYLRCHLGLDVPQGDCRLSVGGEERAWQAGKTLVFDDHTRHAAWNMTERPRVVLLFDFIP
jgi:beta-hydroxylase